MAQTVRDSSAPPGSPASPPATTRDVAARGARVRFVEAGSGPPLLLVHGYFGSRLVWDDALPLLARRFRVIAPDLPGFGDSEKPPPARYPYGFLGFAETLVDVVAAIGCSRLSICGHGIGGSIALTIAATHPHVVDKLIVVDPIVYPARRGTLASIASIPVLGPIAFKQLYGRAAFRRFFRERVYDADRMPEARLDQLFAQFNAPAAREAAYATMLATLDTRPLVASLGRVAAPTLVAWGRGDRTLPVSHGRRLARELSRARFEVFECGHSPAEEVPEAFVDVVSAFLLGPGGKAA